MARPPKRPRVSIDTPDKVTPSYEDTACQLASCSSEKTALRVRANDLKLENGELEVKIHGLENTNLKQIIEIGTLKENKTRTTPAINQAAELTAKITTLESENQELRKWQEEGRAEIREREDEIVNLRTRARALEAEIQTLTAAANKKLHEENDHAETHVDTQSNTPDAEVEALKIENRRMREIINRWTELREEKEKLDAVMASLEKRALEECNDDDDDNDNTNTNTTSVEDQKKERGTFLAPLARHYLKTVSEMLS